MLPTVDAGSAAGDVFDMQQLLELSRTRRGLPADRGSSRLSNTTPLGLAAAGDIFGRIGPSSRKAHSPAHRGQDSIATCTVAVPLPSGRNMFFISRVTPLQHHVRVKHESYYGHCDDMFIGQSASLLRRHPQLGRGPCCAVHTVDMPASISMAVSPGQRVEAMEAARAAVHKLDPSAKDVHAEYVGYYGEVTVTEVLARPTGASTSSVRDGLRAQLRAEVATGDRSGPEAHGSNHAPDSCDALDAKLMLDLLGASPPSSSAATSSASSSRADTLVTTASATVYVDVDGKVIFIGGDEDAVTGFGLLEGEDDGDQRLARSLAATLHTSVASLNELCPREKAPWLDVVLDSPGTMLLPSCAHLNAAAAPQDPKRSAQALGDAGFNGQGFLVLQSLVDAAIAARSLVLAGAPTLTFTQALQRQLDVSEPCNIGTSMGMQLLPLNYREIRWVRISISRRRMPGLSGAGGGGSSSRAGPELTTVTIPVDVALLVAASGGDGAGLPASAVSVAAEVNLAPPSEYADLPPLIVAITAQRAGNASAAVQRQPAGEGNADDDDDASFGNDDAGSRDPAQRAAMVRLGVQIRIATADAATDNGSGDDTAPSVSAACRVPTHLLVQLDTNNGNTRSSSRRRVVACTSPGLLQGGIVVRGLQDLVRSSIPSGGDHVERPSMTSERRRRLVEVLADLVVLVREEVN